MADLDAFLLSTGSLPWAWGSIDGYTVLADWAIANGHGDLMSQYRGTYHDQAQGLAILVRRGGLLPIMSDACARNGLLPADATARGVIAVIGTLIPMRQWGAINDGEHWLVRGPEGFTPMDAPALGRWVV